MKSLSLFKCYRKDANAQKFVNKSLILIQVAIIFSCLPVAATVFPVSQYYKAYVLKTSSAIVVTTVISILTIPIVLLLVTNKNIYNFL